MAVHDHPSQKYDNYLSNPKLKAANVKVAFTQEQVDEYMRCKHDILYFMENYIKIVTLDDGLVQFQPYEFQQKIVRLVHNNRFFIGKIGRQMGKTTIVGAYLLWVVLFHKLQSVAILANKGKTAMGILGKIQKSYENLPLWLQQGIKEWNKGSLILENGSKIVADSTGGSAGRSESHNIVFLDEFAFVPRNVAEEFMTSVYPVITAGTNTKIIMISTPKGMNLFYKYWVDAKNKRNKYKPFEAHWSEVPGRDKAWEKETRANIGDEKFEQEFNTEFLGSTNTLISASKLNELVYVEPVKTYKTQGDNIVKIYDTPKPNRAYIISVDSGEGTGLDYSAFTVIDVTDTPYNIVSTFKSSDVSPLIFPDIIVNIAKIYNNSHLLIESNGIGTQVINTIYNDLEYEYVFATSSRGRGGQTISAGFNKSSKLGIKMSGAVKKIGCSNLKSMIETDGIMINDYNIIEEFSTFVANKKNTYEAESGHHDDLVMTMVLFGWLTKQQYFKDITSIDIRKKLYGNRLKDIEEQIMPPTIQFQQPTEFNESFLDSEGVRWEVVEEFDYHSDDFDW